MQPFHLERLFFFCGVGLPKEQAQYEAAMRFAKEVLFEDPAAIARMKQTDPELFSKVKTWTERVHARLSGSSQENAVNALWSMYDKADGGSGSGGTNIPPAADSVHGKEQTIKIEGMDGENAPPANEETVAHENQEGYNEEERTKATEDSDGGHSSEKTSYQIVKEIKAAEVNQAFKEMFGYEAPYAPDTFVSQIKLSYAKKFVRVYDGVHSRMYGGWLMDADAVIGLNAEEIQRKFALPYKPTYICDVEISAGTNLRRGIANALFGFEGGGIQYDLMGQFVGIFSNQRVIGEN